MMSATGKFILVLGCFDTKGEVFAHLRQCILDQGEQVLTINTGIMGSTEYFPVDIEADFVAQEGGADLSELRKKADRGHAVDIMGKGASKIISNLIGQGQIKAAIGMGGGGGTYITLSAMQHIPLALPKICLSTVAAKDLSRQMGNKNITLMPSVVDVAGLNRISYLLIKQAALAICAMAKVTDTESVATSLGSIAVSMFGNTTACVNICTELLENVGYEVLAFHATGVGGKTMEALIREGYFDAVLDITTTELADELCGGILSAGPDRLNAAAEMGIPQVVVPGCLDMVNFAHLDTVPEQHQSRELYSWSPDVTLLRTNKEENMILGETLAKKLNRSTAATAILLPKKGLSQIDAEGGVFYRPKVDKALFDSIKKFTQEKVRVVEVDAHINDRKFAEILVEVLLKMIEKAKINV